MALYRGLLALSVMITSFAAPVSADQVSPVWDNQRETYRLLFREACAGNANAFFALSAAAWDDADPVALNAYAVALIRGGDCVASDPFDRNEEIRTAMRLSAEQYFPLGMHNHGLNLVTGDFGTPINLGEGVSWMQNAMDQGWPEAAQYLAIMATSGRHGMQVNHDEARFYIRRAERLGLEADLVAQLRAELAAAVASGPSGPGAANLGAGQSGVIYGVFHHLMSFPGDTPDLGDTPRIGGQNFDAEVVYIAQLFDVGNADGCWQATNVFLVGHRLTQGTNYPDGLFENLLATTRDEIAAGHHDQATHFSTLDEAITYREQNIARAGSSLSQTVLTVAEALRVGPQCRDSGGVYVPEPVFARP